MTRNMATSINIPYRCPNCGDSEKFTTLQELRAHLQTDHSFAVYRSQNSLPNIGQVGIGEHKLHHHSSLLELYHADAKILEDNLIKFKDEELNNKRFRTENEQLTSSSISMPYSRQYGSYSPKATFREYGHSSRLNKHLYPKKFTNTDKNRSLNPRHTLHDSSDEDPKDNPFENGIFLAMNKRNSEQMKQDTVPIVALRSNSGIKSYRDQCLHLPQNKLTCDKHIIDSLNALSHNVVLERASQHAVTNSLYTNQEVLSGIEQAAEEKIVQQQLVIDALAQELKEKEKRLANVMHEMESLHHQQSDSMEKLYLLKQKYDHENKQLHHGLQQKQMELDSLSKHITEIKESAVKDSDNTFQRPEKLSSSETFDKNKPINDQIYSAFLPQRSTSYTHSSSANIQNGSDCVIENIQQERLSLGESSTKEKELTVIKEKAKQLERDRQNLLMEMQNLLETAATDNDKLKTELDSQTEKLSKLNYDLEQTKQEQAELLDETRALYQQADVSLSTLKIMLREREQQLKCTSGSLEQAKINQVKLAKERDECLRLAEEREAIYRSLLAANTSQVKTIKEMLESNLEEKLKLEEGLHKLKGKLAAKEEKDRQLTDKVSQMQADLAEKEKTQVELKDKVRRREEKLKKAKHEMERVTNYLKTAAEKEHESRFRLESFISGLIDRATKAEEELQKLKSNQVPGSVKSFSNENEVPDLTHLPGGRSKAFMQGKLNNQGYRSGSKAASRLYPLFDQPKENQQQFHSTQNMAQNIFTTSRCPDRIKIQDVNRGADHNQSSSKHFAGHQNCTHKQNHIIYGQGVHPEALPYPSSFQHSSFMFENTPDVERMIHNINRTAFSEPSDMLYSQKWHKMKEGRPEKLLPIHIDQERIDLSIDDNGIMWEQISPNFSKDAHSKIRRPLLRQSVEHLKTNDDTDVDEDLTDYLCDDEQISNAEAENVVSKLKGTSSSKIMKARMAALQKDPLPFGEKILKHVSSVEPDISMSPVIQGKSKNVYTNDTQRSRLHFEKVQNETSQRIELNPLKSHDYSTTESSEISPLHRARDVQKRVKQLTSLNSSSPVVTHSSKQSDGFEVSHLERESDFSSSSYASFEHFHNPSEQENMKQHTKSGNYQASTIKNTDLYVLNSSNMNENKVNSKDSPKIDLNMKTSLSTKNISKELNQSCIENITIACKNDLEHSVYILPISQATDTSSVVTDDTFIEKQPTTRLQEGIKQFMNSSTADHISAEDATSLITQDQELAKYVDAEIRPAKELRARIMSQNETSVTSSEDDLLDDNVFQQRQSLHRKNGDASTDTDIEKLAMPGHLQKGFVIRKNIPNAKRIKRKKPRPKASGKEFLSQESISSDPDELLDAEKIKRQADRKMRVALFRVFSYLDTRTLLTVSCVNKEWHRVSRHPALWRHVCLGDSSISSDVQETHGLRGRDIIAEESAENYQLAIRGSLESGLEKFLATCHDTITAISIIDCDNILTEKCLWLVSGYCRLLTTLTYQSRMDPITPQLMWALGGGCPGIARLLVQPKHPCEKTNAMNNRCLLLIGQLYPDVQELGLGGKEFDRAGLVPLVKSCQRLKVLHFDHCLGITSDVASALCKAGLKYLQTLTISGTFIEAKAVQHLKDNCRQLKRIHVSVNIQDCVDDPSKQKSKEVYTKMVKALEALKAKSGFGIIFTLETLPIN